MKAINLVNLTGRDVTIEVVGKGAVLLPRSKHRAHVAVQYLRPNGVDGELLVTPEVGNISGTVRVRWPSWGSHRSNVGGLDTAIEHLPAPQVGVGYIVTGIVAEQAALDGRTLGDLFVVMESARGEDRMMASVIPAARATPAMPAALALGEMVSRLESMRALNMQLASLVGEPIADNDCATWYAMQTRRGAAMVCRRGDRIELVNAVGTALECAIELSTVVGVADYHAVLDALNGTRAHGPARPGEVRRVVLGTLDPEMQAVGDLCRRLLIPTVTQDDLDIARDGDLFVECRPATGHARVVGHHQPGDPGYGVAPSGFLLASSLGQVAMALGGLHLLTAEDRITAACDHCLGPALLGRCPGVTVAEVERWLLEHEPHRGGWRTIDEHTAAVEKTAAHRAPVVALAANGPEALDLRGLGLTVAASWIGTFRHDLRVFVTDVEVKRPPIGWPKGQPCKRVTMHGIISAEHFAAFKMWAELQGGRDFFPDVAPQIGAARGVVGFYI